MSTVEKAFLKSLEKENKNLEDEISKGIEVESTIAKKDAGQLTSSKRGIAHMEQTKKYSQKELEERGLIHSNMKDRNLLNQYRNLRTRLLANCKKENFVTLVTSAVSDNDTAIVSANLAATFALDESKTSMLIEANIADPRLNNMFDMSNNTGLIDYLEKDSSDSDIVLQKTGIPRLRFVPSGVPRENATEYFSSEKMKIFIQELVTRYPDRFPIINTPSISSSADARILLELCDQVILVVPYGECTEEDILKASITIGSEKLAGLVLNNF
jgi:capsular exopolysaccharide synthesis family protein